MNNYFTHILPSPLSCNEIIIKECSLNNIPFLLIDFIPQKKIHTLGQEESKCIINAFTYAHNNALPVVALITSGGIRIQEGTQALVQMINIVSVINSHNQSNLLYIAIIKDTTLGGVSASLVPLADIIIALPKQTYGFTGKRIVEKTTFENLDEHFQSSEFALEHGMIDMIVTPENLWNTISQILTLHYPNYTRKQNDEKNGI